jgi:hypothetical protein
MKKPTRKHLPCRECGTSHNNTLSSTLCDSCGKKLHTENLKQAELEDEVDLGERITELEANQPKLDLNKIKADAIREAVKLYKNKVFDGCDIYSDGLLDYADKLEQRK